MEYKDFLQEVELRVKSRMGKEVRITVYPVIKNNSVALDSLSILQKGENISPAIYLNSYYKEYCSGRSMDKIINEIIWNYERARTRENLDVSFYTDITKAKKRIVCRLINTEKNKKLLQEIPHQRFLNLEIVYYYLMEQCEIGTATILIRNEHLKLWGIEEAELHEIALRNTLKLLPYDFFSIEEMLKELLEEEGDKEENFPMYILSNQEKSFGAVCLIYHNVLEKIAEYLHEDYYVLPSSVHECMIVPVSLDSDERELQEMVKEINETQVEPEEVLSDTVYRYSRRQKQLCIAVGA